MISLSLPSTPEISNQTSEPAISSKLIQLEPRLTPSGTSLPPMPGTIQTAEKIPDYYALSQGANAKYKVESIEGEGKGVEVTY